METRHSWPIKLGIYLCGAINGRSDSDCRGWRELVKQELSERYWFLDPMRRDFRGKEDESVETIVQGDYEDIANASIVLVAADQPSWGTAMELHHAYGTGKQTIVVCGSDRVSPWLRYHASVLVRSLDEAIALLKGRAA